MNKRRITLNLDEDLVEALEQMQQRSLSAAANQALRGAVEATAHRAALLAWLEELNAAHGEPSAQDRAEARRVVDELFDEVPSEAVATDAAA